MLTSSGKSVGGSRLSQRRQNGMQRWKSRQYYRLAACGSAGGFQLIGHQNRKRLNEAGAPLSPARGAGICFGQRPTRKHRELVTLLSGMSLNIAADNSNEL